MEAQEKLANLQRFLKFDPENQSLWVDAVRLAIEVQAWDIAKILVDEASPVLLQKADVNALAGHVLLAHKEYEKAVGYLEQAIEKQVSQLSVWINLAYCYFYSGQHSLAMDVLKGKPELLRDFPHAFHVLSARLAYQQNDLELAIKHLRVLHELGDATAESAGFLALLLFEADREYEVAMQLANLALAKNPHAIEALIARASLQLDSRDYEAAYLDCQLAVTYHPQSGRAWTSLAQVQFNNFQFDLARDSAESAVKYMPEHIGSWHLLGWSCLMLADYEKALWSFQQSYEIDSRFGETHGGLASAYAHLGEERLANNHLKLAEKLDREGVASTYARMVLLNKDGASDKARDLLSKKMSSASKKINVTPQELISKRMQELTEAGALDKTVH